MSKTQKSPLTRNFKHFIIIYRKMFLPEFLGQEAVSQRLNRDSLKSLNLSRFSGFAVAPYLSVLGKDGVLGDKGQDIVAPCTASE